jgi:hypothetical protein
LLFHRKKGNNWTVLENSIGMFTDYKLYSIPTVGGQPEFIMDTGCYGCDLSRDGNAFATLTLRKNGNVEWKTWRFLIQ